MKKERLLDFYSLLEPKVVFFIIICLTFHLCSSRTIGQFQLNFGTNYHLVKRIQVYLYVSMLFL